MKSSVKNAFIIGSTSTLAYMFVYFVRNILSVVTPKIIEDGTLNESQIGTLSSVFFITYAIGQLINGALGDKIKGKIMMSAGLVLAGITNLAFCFKGANHITLYISYALCGYFLSMIYGPMTKLVAENTEPLYASRCTVAYNFSSHLGSPIAGMVAVILSWTMVFLCGGVTLIITGIATYIIITMLEKNGAITPIIPVAKNSGKNKLKLLVQRKIGKFTLVSILTGIVRTTVVFWLPTYYTQYLDFSAESAAVIFTISTLFTSINAFVAIIVYEKLNRNLEATMIISFSLSALSFLLCIFVRQPILNIILINFAIFAANGSSTMLWSRYCPGLRSTGLVSSATGFLDFVSYLAAAISSTVFANAVSDIGWNGLIIVWFALMFIGIIVSIPFDKNTHYLDE
ncbi:MAG: MFS transporter [Acutalibacteraceae bacterium]|nr:MFS transporter [Acutalibacteraceae bacterium]